MLKNFYNSNKIILSGLGIIIYFFIVYLFSVNMQVVNVKLFGAASIISICVIIALLVIKEYLKNKSVNYKKIISGIVLIGLILRTVYICYSTINDRQHDVGGFDGHLGYIEQIYDTGELPKTNSYQLYHAPLHHIISAFWLKINDGLGIEMIEAKEGIQFLTAIYSSLMMILAYCILKEMDIKDIYKLPVMCIMAVHPTFIILAGSINNDMLVNLCVMFILLYLIKWYKNANFKNISLLAFFTALCALSKISGTIVAIPIIFIFFRKLYEEIKKRKKYKDVIKKYIAQFIVFGVIALGLGLSYAIRNMILFDQSIFFVHQAPEWLYCGDETVAERFGFFSKEFLKVYCDPFSDSNVWAYLIKSSLFGEFKMDDGGSVLLQAAIIIFNIILIVLSLFSLINFKKDDATKKGQLAVITKMFVIYYFAQIGIYVYGNIKMPYGCTMDFRYVVPTIFIGMIFIAQSLERGYKTNLKDIYKVVSIFSVLTIVLELTCLNRFYI